MPFAGCSVFDFRSTKMPECILDIDRSGGILVAYDALMNLLGPDEYFSDQSRQMMQEMGFLRPGIRDRSGISPYRANPQAPSQFSTTTTAGRGCVVVR